MVEAEYVIKKVPSDLEAALTGITGAVSRFESEITVNLNGARYQFGELFVGGQRIERNGKSVMALRTLKFKEGAKLHIQVKGKDEQEAAKAYMQALEKQL